MSASNVNRKPAGDEHIDGQDAELEQQSSSPRHDSAPFVNMEYRSPQHPVVPELPFSYTMNILPLQFYGQLSHPYSSIGSNYPLPINPLSAQQFVGQGLESLLGPQLSPLQQYSQLLSESAALFHDQQLHANINAPHPPPIANFETTQTPIEPTVPREAALPTAETAASTSQPLTSVEESSQLLPSSLELTKPKRPLSAESGSNKNNVAGAPKQQKQKYQPNGTGFEDLAKEISRRWKSIDKERLDECTQRAEADTERYQNELTAYNIVREASLSALQQAQVASVSEDVWKSYLAEAEKQKPPRNRKRKKK